MWKYIIAFIVVIFVIAFIIGQNNKDSLDDENSIEVAISPTQENTDSMIACIASHVEERQGCSNHQTLETINLNVRSNGDQISHQLLTRISYTTSYNKNTKCPNWVAWHLTAEHTDGEFPRRGVPYFEDGEACGIGKVDRGTSKGDYFVDMEIEAPRPDFDDWSEMPAGMSHGHMCPAGDNKWSKVAMNQSFLLTNMCPQDESLNGGGWKKLEEKCRDWAKKHGDIYIVSGPLFYEDVRRSFGKNKIGIPDAFFKVVLCVNGAPKAIGFIYQNNSSSQSMKDCVHSVDDVEEIAGMDFFYSLPDSIEDEVEAMTDLKEW